MKIVLSLVPITRGGGLTVSAGMARAALARDTHTHTHTHEISIAVRASAAASMGFSKADQGSIVLPDRRLAAEASLLRFLKQAQPDVVLSGFGPLPIGRPLLRSTSFATVCAYSNLFYPEIAFWAHLPRRHQAMKRLIDSLRLRSTMQADVVFFETHAVRDRALEQHPPRHGQRFEVLAPSFDETLRRQLALTPNNQRKRPAIALFSGRHPNKGWHLLPAIASSLESKRIDVDLVLTVDSAPDLEGATEMNHHCRISTVGSVALSDRATFLRSIDGILLLSRLESYSNNTYEAWEANIPLLMPRLDWATSAANNAAYYFDRNNAEQAGVAIIEALAYGSDTAKQAEAASELSRLGTPADRLNRAVQLLSQRSR